MRYSRLFPHTTRNVPREVEGSAYELLLKGGYVRSLGHGLYSLLPMGMRVFNRLKGMIAREMLELGGQEVLTPIINPMEIWKKSGRDVLAGEDIASFKDKLGREMVISPTHEEAMVELIRQSLQSLRNLPVFLYQFQTKYREEEKARTGLIRTREFIMKDAYSFHRSYYDLNNFFPRVFHAYEKIFKSCNLPLLVAEAGVGYMGGEKSYEFLVPSDRGDNIVIRCSSCGYTANQDIAIGVKPTVTEIPRDMETVETPGISSMESLSAFLSLPLHRLAKTMAYKTTKGIVFAVVRGDYDVSREKLSIVLSEPVTGKASEKELKELGLSPGYLSPLNRMEQITIVVDDIVADSSNLVIGSGQEGLHCINANFGRDFEADFVADISRITEGHRCYYCGGDLVEERAIEIGHIFKLGEFYTKSMGLSLPDERNRSVYPHMGAYGIGMGRLMSVIVANNRDAHGIKWPASVAPFYIFLMSIGNSLYIKDKVESLEKELGNCCLLDDRHMSPGKKFRDADLLGIPYRILLTRELLDKGKVEVKERETGKTWKISYGRVKDFVEHLEKKHGVF
ncbi:proline--tRNA ligase [Spirochaetia bacterium 38H-sp]|uniref:Proline--tRNA ligase n=1 Tax=Rarispira pelagica TaxID=3141764 RepID=A0ABU9UA69_9SPIR